MKARYLGFFCALLIYLFCISPQAFAFLNNFETASIRDQGQWTGKLGLSTSDDFFAFFAGLNYPVSKGFEVTGRGGILDVDVDNNDTGVLIGIGGKYKAAFFANPKYPDIALRGTYDLGFADGKALHSLAGAVLVSKVITFPESKNTISPYAGPELEILGGSLNDDTDLNFHFTLGTEFALEKQFGIIFEVKLGGQSSLGIGASYKF